MRCCKTFFFSSIYHAENNLIFKDDDKVCFVLNQHAELDFYRTEINLGSFNSLFFNLFLAIDWIIYSLHISFF